jgi:hypothetical protein
MKFLIRLYPANWRRRYGTELEALIDSHPFTPQLAVDLIAGALDAHLHPQLINTGGLAEDTVDSRLATSTTTGARTMLAKALDLRCGENQRQVSPEDSRLSTQVNLYGSLLLAVAWLLALTQFPHNAYVLALGTMAYVGPLILSSMFTSLKTRSAQTRTILIGSQLAATTGICLLAGYISQS